MFADTRGKKCYNDIMKITLNGHDFDAPDGISLEQLLELRRQSGHLKTSVFAVERNKEVVPRKLLPDTALTEGDVIEVVVAVGGG